MTYICYSNVLDTRTSHLAPPGQSASKVYLATDAIRRFQDEVGALDFIMQLQNQPIAYKMTVKDSAKLPALPSAAQKLVQPANGPFEETIAKFVNTLTTPETMSYFIINDDVETEWEAMVEVHDEAIRYVSNFILQLPDNEIQAGRKAVTETLSDIMADVGVREFVVDHRVANKLFDTPPALEGVEEDVVVPTSTSLGNISINQAMYERVQNAGDDTKCSVNKIACMQEFQRKHAALVAANKKMDAVAYAFKIAIYARREAFRYSKAAQTNWKVLALCSREEELNPETTELVEKLREAKRFTDSDLGATELISELTSSPWKWWFRIKARNMLKEMAEHSLFQKLGVRAERELFRKWPAMRQYDALVRVWTG